MLKRRQKQVELVARPEQFCRNYDLLLKRRAQKKSLSERQAARKRPKGGGSRKSDEEGESEEDVEELLFEQVYCRKVWRKRTPFQALGFFSLSFFKISTGFFLNL